jgi:eukaryotic-like serine/threonine-protein kinase
VSSRDKPTSGSGGPGGSKPGSDKQTPVPRGPSKDSRRSVTAEEETEIADAVTPAPPVLPGSGGARRRPSVSNPLGGVGNPVGGPLGADPNRRTDPIISMPGHDATIADGGPGGFGGPIFGDPRSSDPRSSGSGSGRTSGAPPLGLPPLSPQPRQLVAGRYELIEPIGEGSMGRIFLAEQISVGRRVAIKIINRELSSKYDTIARFQQEARLLASVKNEHIVDIYDIGETEQGDPFIAMELVDGQSLATVLREQGALDPTRTIRILLQVASALSTVHEAGVVHRDLKPANIMLLDGGGRAGEVVKILDFGLAKVLSDREATGRLTRTGSIVGTPEYMSPEQVAGGNVDHRADIYGLGCTAYEMACGHPPFMGAEVATLYKHLHEEAPPLAQARPTFPRPLAEVIHRCLAKNPDDRYPSAREVYDALLDAADQATIPRRDLRVGHSGDQLPVSTVRPAPVGTPPRFRYQRREVALIAAIVLVTGLLGGVLIDRAARPPVADDDRGAAAAPAATTGPGVLLVTTTPAGVEVKVDDGAPARSPYVARDVKPGKHRVQVRGRGWVARDAEVNVVAGQLAQLDVKLERPRYTMKIESTPSGAQVTLDGQPIGETPLETQITELEFHQLSFSHDGYRPRELFLPPDTHEPLLKTTLYPVLLHAGTLIVNSEHSGRVIIDGQDLGEWTPTGEIQLAPGRHTVELVDAENIRRKAFVTIVEGQLTNLDVPAPKMVP